jgi:hypothetical protein
VDFGGHHVKLEINEDERWLVYVEDHRGRVFSGPILLEGSAARIELGAKSFIGRVSKRNGYRAYLRRPMVDQPERAWECRGGEWIEEERA